jgi:HlyD family secretion protein
MRARFFIAFAVAIPLLGASGTAYFNRSEDPELPPFTFVTVDRGDVIQTVTTTGQLTPMVNVEVSTQISGLLVEVNVDFNTPVKKGQVLARIDPSTYEQQLRRAQADLEAAEATHALSEINVRRLRGLIEQDLVTQQDYDQATALLRQSRANLLTRKADVQNARVDLERCTIVAPIDGIVIFKQAEVGKTVVSSFSAPTLFVIARDLSSMRIVAPINEVDVSMVRVGQEVAFTVDAVPGRKFKGRLAQVRNPYTPSENKQTSQQPQSGINTFDAVIEVDNADLLLRPSLTAHVSIVVEKRVGVLRIPNGALRVELPKGLIPERASSQAAQNADPANATVYRLPNSDKSGVPQAVNVRIGMSDGLMTEILQGLKPGDRVITGVAAEWGSREGGGLFR